MLFYNCLSKYRRLEMRLLLCVMESHSTAKSKGLSFSEKCREVDVYQSNHLSTDETQNMSLLAEGIRRQSRDGDNIATWMGQQSQPLPCLFSSDTILESIVSSGSHIWTHCGLSLGHNITHSFCHNVCGRMEERAMYDLVFSATVHEHSLLPHTSIHYYTNGGLICAVSELPPFVVLAQCSQSTCPTGSRWMCECTQGN